MLPLIGCFLALLSVANSLTVHLVAHTHDDVGWQVTVDQYYIGQVQYIITTVIEQLQANPQRKFIYVEQAFFQRWWRQQTAEVQQQVKDLVNNGQLEFINGGWCMHDEASTHFIDMVDQTTYGHRFIKEQFGKAPKIGWQIDPFGHSATQAALLSAEVGFEALFFGRMDYQDYTARSQTKDLEFIWRASPSYGATADVFTGKFWNGYGPPAGFNWDIGSNDLPMIDDPLLEGYNVPQRVDDFVKAAMEQSKIFKGEHVMWTMGSDFQYTAAHVWFDNLDKLIKAVNADGRVTAQYSTPSLYVQSINQQNLTYSLKTDDLFPYADNADSYWTGYFTSRPALKKYVRVQSQFLQIARQLDAYWIQNQPINQPIKQSVNQSINQSIVRGDGNATEALWEAMGVAQHHDAVSGTAKQDVTYDYAKRLSVGAQSSDDVINQSIASLLTQPGGNLPSFSYCPLANQSVCDATLKNNKLVVSLYNSLARVRSELVRVPINQSIATVYNSENTVIKSEVIANPSINPARLIDSLDYEVRFLAQVPAMGLNTFFILQGKVNQSVDVSINQSIDRSHESVDQSINQSVDQSDEEWVIVEKPVDNHSVNEKSINQHRHRRSLKGIKQSINQSINQSIKESITSDPVFIENQYWRLDFDSNGMLSKITNQSTGDSQSISQSFFWYPSFQVSGQQNSGAYIFRPNVSDSMGYPVSTSASISVQIGSLTQQITQSFTDWLIQTVRLIDSSPTIEFEYTVGPIPIEDGQGKEIVSRFSTNIQSQSTFFTDSNGREWQKRVRNYRPTWKWNPTQPISGNYYPCNTGMWLSDNQSAMSILTDRSQGCTSLVDGQLEYMIHRRTLMDDGRGVNQPINETGLSGNGLVTTGTHYLSFSTPAEILAVTRPLQSRIYSYLHHSYASLSDQSINQWLTNHHTQFSASQTPLPENVELMSFYKTSQSELLIRLAHSYGVDEHAVLSFPVTVDLALLFIAELVPTTITEVSLTNNQSPQDIIDGKLKWNIENEKQKHKKQSNRHEMKGTKITLQPAQIRTFLFTY